MIRVGSPEDHGLALDVIQIDGGTQSRAALNDHVVNEYAEAIKAGATFPPIVIFYDGKKHWLADGFHRFHAYQKAGKSKVAADVRQGTRRDAILHSVGANETHGLRRTRDDKRRAVLTLLSDPEWSAKPERWIATTANVSHTYVQKIRAEHLATLPDRPAEVEVQRGGTVYTQKVAKAAKSNAREALVNDEPSPEVGPQAEAFQSQGTGAGTLADREGRHEGEAASVDLPTISDADARTDAERDAYVIQWEWDRASNEGRALFLARNNLTEQPKVGAHDAEGCNTHSNAVEPASINTDGRANMEPDDVDRSAERASSAVEVGAPVSPEGAQEFPLQTSPETGSAGDPSPTSGQMDLVEAGTGQNCAVLPQEPCTAEINPSAAPTAEPEATPSPPPASGTLSNPQPTSSPVADKAGEPQDRNEPVSGSSAINPKPFCLKLKDGHCKIAFETAALCAACNAAKARAAA